MEVVVEDKSDLCGRPPLVSPPCFLSLPVELHSRILLLLDPTDVLSYARTCKKCHRYARDNRQLWKHQWHKLSLKTPFAFPPTSSLVELGVNFKDMCRRLWKVLITESEDCSAAFGGNAGLVPVKCPQCKEYTCNCPEDRTARVSVDIGGKITWLISSNYTLERHLTMIAVPKVLKCYDCDTTLNRNEVRCDCAMNASPRGSLCGRSSIGETPYCHSRLMSSHTALEYYSQPLASTSMEEDILSKPVMCRPFCLFCDDDKVNRMLCEREMVTSTKQKMLGVRPPYLSGEEEFLNYSALSPLTNGYCRDTAAILGADNVDLVSPLIALEHEEAFSVVKAFLVHIFTQNKIVNELQRPNCSLIFTYAKMPLAVKEALLRFLFEEMKISRLCLLPKALAIARLFETSNCIVVDSGATNTYVWVVLDGRVEEERTKTVAVGGWHLAQFLKQALAWKESGREIAAGATVSSFDTCVVKEKCRLHLNLKREEQRAGIPRTETIHIKTQKDSQRKLEMAEINISTELYLAPEMMFASLDLPGMVAEATRDLPEYYVKECFSNILVTGGNTDLHGFSQRLSVELREKLPEHSPIINVCPYPTGTSNSWNTVMGANAVKIPPPYEDVLSLRHPGTPLWMSREEYIVFGSQQIADSFEAGGRDGMGF